MLQKSQEMVRPLVPRRQGSSVRQREIDESRSSLARSVRSASARMPPNSKRGSYTPRSTGESFHWANDVYLLSDEYCPHCDNHFVLEAVTPKPTLQVEGDDARMDNRYVKALGTENGETLTITRMLKDDRVRGDQEKSIFNFKDISDRMG